MLIADKQNNSVVKLIIAVILVQLSFMSVALSQKYDLIVTNQGDSIACKIDSISSTNVYFEMRFRNKWTTTHIAKSDIIVYKMNEFNKKDISFKPHTSYIAGPNPLLIHPITRNIAYGSASYLLYHYSISLNYERIFKVSKDARKTYSYRVGYGIIDSKQGKILLATFNTLRGKTKNKFETNIGAALINEEHSYGPHFVTLVLNLGYRLQTTDKKFVFRTGVGVPKGVYAALGYSF